MTSVATVALKANRRDVAKTRKRFQPVAGWDAVNPELDALPLEWRHLNFQFRGANQTVERLPNPEFPLALSTRFYMLLDFLVFLIGWTAVQERH